MRARHSGRPTGGRLRWVAAAAGLAVAGAAIFAVTPATAAGTTTNAQLSLSGVATKSSILGGSLIGIHPGDSVDFQASGLPTAGLENIPALNQLVSSLLSPLLGQFQVVLHTSASFPGGAHDVTIGGPTSGPCKGQPDYKVTFPNAGTYNFSWNIAYVLPVLLGCTHNGVSDSNLNLLKKAGVALNATNQWVGQIAVADHPPTGGIGIQLPGISIAPSLPVVGQLPTLGLGGLTIQGHLTLPTLSGPPGGGGSGGGAGGGGAGGGGGSSAAPDCVPCDVMTHVGLGGGPGQAGANQGTGSQIGNGIAQAGVNNNGVVPVTSTAPAVPGLSTEKHVNLAANRAPAAQMPLLLAFIAIIALALVTGIYARLFLLRR